MQKKHNAIYSDPTGAAAAASPARHRTARTKASETKTPRGASSGLAAATPEPAIDREAVARLAYSYWAARGFTGGSSEEDWLRAEQELRESIAESADA